MNQLLPLLKPQLLSLAVMEFKIKTKRGLTAAEFVPHARRLQHHVLNLRTPLIFPWECKMIVILCIAASK